jgi:hypothetical protein
MDRELLAQYLRHLDGLLDALQKKEHIELEDVAPIRSELRDFRARIARATFLKPEVRKLFETVDLRIDDKHLEGSRKTIFLNLYSVIGVGSPLLRAWRAKKKEKIGSELARVRGEIQDLALMAAP